MPDSITRKEQAMRTRMSLLNAALLLFQERGVTNVKVTDICEEAGVSVGAFYHHFPSKEDLIERSYQGIDDHLSELMEGRTFPSQTEKILTFFSDATEVMESFGPGVTGAVYGHILSSGDSYTFSRKRYPYQLVRNALSDGITSGEFSPDTAPDPDTRTLMRIVRGIAYDWSAAQGTYSLSEEVMKILTQYLKIFQA